MNHWFWFIHLENSKFGYLLIGWSSVKKTTFDFNQTFDRFQSKLSNEAHEFINELISFFGGHFYSHYGTLHTRHFCSQYCDKKIILSHGCLKAKVSS